jgi:hypothetical protein
VHDAGFLLDSLEEDLQADLPPAVLDTAALSLVRIRGQLVQLGEQVASALVEQMADRPRAKRNADGAGAAEDK